MEPDICLWIDDLDSNFKVFHELMAHKIREILLVLSPYDAFIMEEDTSLSTRISTPNPPILPPLSAPLK